MHCTYVYTNTSTFIQIMYAFMYIHTMTYIHTMYKHVYYCSYNVSLYVYSYTSYKHVFLFTYVCYKYAFNLSCAWHHLQLQVIDIYVDVYIFKYECIKMHTCINMDTLLHAYIYIQTHTHIASFEC